MEGTSFPHLQSLTALLCLFNLFLIWFYSVKKKWLRKRGLADRSKVPTFSSTSQLFSWCWRYIKIKMWATWAVHSAPLQKYFMARGVGGERLKIEEQCTAHPHFFQIKMRWQTTLLFLKSTNLFSCFLHILSSMWNIIIKRLDSTLHPLCSFPT